MKTANDLNNMKMVEIIDYYNSLVDNQKVGEGFKTAGLKTFNSKRKAVERTLAAQEIIRVNTGMAEPKKSIQVKERQSGKPSKMSLIREALVNQEEVSRQSLAQLVDSDERNVHIMVTILCTPKRTKDYLVVTYDRKNQVYQRIH